MSISSINNEFADKLFKLKLSEIRDDLKKEFQNLDHENIKQKLYHQSAGYNKLIDLLLKQTKTKSELLLSAVLQAFNKDSIIDKNFQASILSKIKNFIDTEINLNKHQYRLLFPRIFYPLHGYCRVTIALNGSSLNLPKAHELYR